jgi:hypothetical protein
MHEVPYCQRTGCNRGYFFSDFVDAGSALGLASFFDPESPPFDAESLPDSPFAPESESEDAAPDDFFG